LVALFDLPSPEREKDFDKFMKCYSRFVESGQFVVSPLGSLEECYPGAWRKAGDEVKAMTSKEKTALADVVGKAITREEFEGGMPHVLAALQKAWRSAHQ